VPFVLKIAVFSVFVAWFHPQENHYTNECQKSNHHNRDDVPVIEEVHILCPFQDEVVGNDQWQQPRDLNWVRLSTGFCATVFYPPLFGDASVRLKKFRAAGPDASPDRT